MSIFDILQCPITKDGLKSISEEELLNINRLIRLGKALNFSQKPVSKEISNGIISNNGKYIYEIIDDVIILLSENAIVFNSDELNNLVKNEIAIEKKIMQDFYDNIGWKKDDENNFNDALKFEDLRQVSKEYIHRCHLRINKYLSKGGKYLLDIASGPVQYDEYIEYSKNFDYRVCIDISLSALKEAKKKLKDRGIYILGDITNIPLRNECIDAAISLHTIYHVPENEQKNAFEEVSRVLKSGSVGIVVYSWGANALLMKISCFFPSMLVRSIRRLKGCILNKTHKQYGFYFKPMSFSSFNTETWGFYYDIFTWRSISTTFLKIYIHKYLLGRVLLRLIFFLEEHWPKFFGKYGQYPLIIMRKKCTNENTLSC